MTSSIDILLRTIVVGVLAYAGLVLTLRIAGKRTLSKWNAFDLIVTVALGSSMATTILSNQTSLAQGVMAFVVLISLQFLISWVSVRFRSVENLVKASPTLLLYRGSYRHDAMKKERVTESEIRAALRQNGIASIAEVDAVVLETNGRFSVIRQIGPHSASVLAGVAGFDENAGK